VEQEGKYEGASVTCEDNGLIEKLQKHLEEHENDLQTWTDSLVDLSEIEDAFKRDGKPKLNGKTILDIGTDCVKPLYIALKFKPKKIMGINEEFPYSYTSDIEQKSKMFTGTEIRFYDCSFFDKETLKRILKKEKMNKGFDFILVSKTLHHFRTGECKRKRDKKHDCEEVETERNCTYRFEEKVIFEDLLGLGKRVIIYEYFDPNKTDDDKVRGRGGYFTTEELRTIFEYLSGTYKVEFIKPEKFHVDKEALNRVDSIIRKVDTICFYVEKQLKNPEKS
jgi:hypothetical protein